MRQISKEMNPSPTNGRPIYNLGDYIRQRCLCEEGVKHLKKEKKKVTPSVNLYLEPILRNII